jgi:hypothetical protein
MKTARVCFLWHMHQSYDTDPVAGFASRTWLRLRTLNPLVCRPS